MAGTLFFVADDGTNGRALWKSDGTTAGTVLVKDIDPTPGFGSDPHSLTDVSGTILFSAAAAAAAAAAADGYELWKSDGTSGGTVLVRDINPGPAHSFPSSLTKVGSQLYFSADDGSTGTELWKSDGTPGGTVRVSDARPGAAGSLPSAITRVGSAVFFRAADGSSGQELWKSDGTSGGTVLVKDINPGALDSVPALLTEVGGTLVFAANDGTYGSELWRSDGTRDGTGCSRTSTRARANPGRRGSPTPTAACSSQRTTEATESSCG